MLVDLSRNDLGRVCEPGSVEVVDFMTVRRYSHVMHIESTVVGRLAPDRTALDVARRVLPGRHTVRSTQAAGDGDHRRARADPARPLRRGGRLPRLRRRPRRRDRDPDGRRAGRHCLRTGGWRASSPTPTRRPRTPRAGTRRRRSCGPSQWRGRSVPSRGALSNEQAVSARARRRLGASRCRRCAVRCSGQPCLG